MKIDRVFFDASSNSYLQIFFSFIFDKNSAGEMIYDRKKLKNRTQKMFILLVPSTFLGVIVKF